MQSISKAFPQEFINRMREQLGDEFEEFIKEYDKPYVKSLRVNTLKIGTEECVKLLQDNCAKDVATADFVQWEKAGVYYDGTGDTLLLDSPGKSPLHEAGAYYIQEASAMLPVTLLDIDRDGLKVLDLCAAPGGKSTQIAAYLRGRGLLVSNEIISSRADILSENIERMGVTNALVISEDPISLSDRFVGFFDRILVDAPCSGEGMFRKHPEAMEEWSESNVELCANRQDMILDCAVKMLAPQGKIVYSTCTFATLEDEETMARFLERHPEFAVCDAPQRLFPHKMRGEGHFAVSFHRSAEKNMNAVPEEKAVVNVVANKSRKKSGKTSSVLSSDEAKILKTFIAETFLAKSDIFGRIDSCICENTKAEEGCDKLVRFGDSIYLAPKIMPETTGLKVKRAGLKLGEFKKNRFEPDHALAMALRTEEVLSYCSYDCNSEEIKGYLNGMTLAFSAADSDCSVKKIAGSKGWCLICVNGVSIGWGKIAGEMIKNHYPKGLRVR